MRRTLSLQIPHIMNPEQLPAEIRWVVRGGDSPEGLVYRGDWQTAANHAVGCRVEVLLAASQVLLIEARLPAMNRQRLAKAIPYALEEQLAADVDTLHFAVGQRLSDESVMCAVADREVLQAVLDELKTVGVQADLLSSELFALPYESGAWSIWLLESEDGRCRALLRTGPQTGAEIDVDNLVLVLSYALEAMDHAIRPQRLLLLHSQDRFDAMSIEPAMANTVAETMNTVANTAIDALHAMATEFGLEPEVRHLQPPSLVAMVESEDLTHRLDLLQGEFSRKEQVEKLLRPWIPAAAMLLIWVVAQLGMSIADYYSLKEQDLALRTEIEKVYRDAFPEARTIVDPKVQMQRGLDKLKSGNKSGVDMLTLLSKAGEVLQATAEMSINGIRYKDAQLDVDLHISDLQALDTLKAQLMKEEQLTVDIVSASAREGKVESRLKIQMTAQKAG